MQRSIFQNVLGPRALAVALVILGVCYVALDASPKSVPPPSQARAVVTEAHTHPVFRLAYAPDGTTLVSASLDGTMRAWDAVTGRFLGEATFPLQDTFPVTFAPDGRSIARGGEGLVVCPWVAARGIESLTEEVTPAIPGVAFSALAYAPDGRILAAGASAGVVWLWDTAAHPVGGQIGGKTKPLCLAWAPDGRTLAVGGCDGVVRLLDPLTGQLRRALPGHEGGVSGLAYRPDGRALATGEVHGSRVRLWDPATGRETHLCEGPTTRQNVVAFAPDGRLLAAGGRDGVVGLWDPHTCRRVGMLTDHTATVLGLAFSPDGQTLASGSLDRTIRLWNVGQ
jgi:WD40 repeat protein